MNARIGSLLALSLAAASPAAFAQYTMTLTGVGDGVVSNGVYVSPYQGTIQSGGQTVYSGYMICDDFNTESYLNTPWQATAASSNGLLNGSEKFVGNGSVMFDGNSYTAQQAYNAAAWLAVQLVQPGNVTNAGAQVNYGFAIWNIFDGFQANTSASVLATDALAFANANTVQSGVTVYTPSTSNPNGVNQSQEFLVVNPNAAPEVDPATAGSALTLLFGGIALVRGRRANPMVK